MAQISKNSFDLIGIALHKMRGKGFRGFIGTLLFVAPLALLCLIPFAGWAIALFCWGVLNTGYIRFMRRLMAGENPPYMEVFSEVRTGWFELYLGALIATMFILGSAFLIIPGLVLIGFYSMSLYTAEHFHIEKLGEALYQTAVRMDGNKTTMFGYKSLFYAIYVVLFVAIGLSGWGVYLLWAVNPLLSVLVAILAVLVYVLLLSWVTEYYHATNEVFFQEMLGNYEFKNTKEFHEEVLAKKEEAEAPAEEQPIEEPKPEQKAEPKKVAPKRAPAKKKTTKK